MLHVDDDERFDEWLRWLDSLSPPASDELETRSGRLLLMLFAALGGRGRPIAELPYVLASLQSDNARRVELIDLLGVLRDQARADTEPLPLDPRVPLQTHARYALYEIVAARGLVSAGGVLRDTREGVLRITSHRTDCFFITLAKSEADYSPTTRYEDYPISPTLFHWESQSTTSADSTTGQRYINHAESGDRILLFARDRKRDSRGETLPYTCLGLADYVHHESSRRCALPGD
jgi:hypothetical protein